jgi:hypothetical protein
MLATNDGLRSQLPAVKAKLAGMEGGVPALNAGGLCCMCAQVRAQDTTSVILGVAQRGGASLQAAWTFLRTCAAAARFLLLLTSKAGCSARATNTLPMHLGACRSGLKWQSKAMRMHVGEC